MNVQDKIIVDMSKLKLEPKKQKLFRINQELDEIKVKTKIVCVYEYELKDEQEAQKQIYERRRKEKI